MNKVWVRGDLCLRYTNAPRDPFIRWMGYVPFRFGYLDKAGNRHVMFTHPK